MLREGVSIKNLKTYVKEKIELICDFLHLFIFQIKSMVHYNTEW